MDVSSSHSALFSNFTPAQSQQQARRPNTPEQAPTNKANVATPEQSQETSQRTTTTERLRTPASQNSDASNTNTNRQPQRDASFDNNSEDEPEAIELRPLVVEANANPATRAFTDVANSGQRDFQIVDIYV